MGQTVIQAWSRVEVWAGLVLIILGLFLYGLLRRMIAKDRSVRAADTGSPDARHPEFVILGLWLGPVLMAAGAYVAFVYGIPYSIPLFAAGFALVLVLSAWNRKYRHENAGLRRGIDFASAALNASLLGGTLIVANVIAFRYGGQPYDLTRERTHSLSSQTLNQLTTLTRPLSFTLVFGQGPRAVAQRERVLQLLELYRSANPAMIKVSSVLNPFRAEETLKRVPDLAILQGGGVLIELGEGDQIQSRVVRNRDMFPPPISPSRARGRDGRFESEFSGEDAITSALIHMREAKQTKVAFTTGHGEPSINDLNPRGDGLGIWKSRLSAVGCEASELDLIKDDLPADLGLLVVVEPKSPFKPAEVAKIQAYADRRGPMLFLFGNQTATGLEDLLRTYHIEMSRGTATDLRLNLNGVPQVVFALPQQGAVHPIVDSFKSRRILIPEGAPLRIIGTNSGASPSEAAAPNPELTAVPILKTSRESWAEMERTAGPPKFDKGVDEAGPVVVGVAVSGPNAPSSVPNTPPDPRPRLVLFSGRSMAGNLVVEIENANLDLVMNAASWLRGRPDAVGISPSTHIALQLTADPQLRVRLIVVPTVTAMMFIIGMGIVVYISRRE